MTYLEVTTAYPGCTKTAIVSKSPPSSSLPFPALYQTHVHGRLELLNAQINPELQHRHGSLSFRFDISAMTFARSQDKPSWQSGDDQTASRSESYKNVKLLMSSRSKLTPQTSAVLSSVVFGRRTLASCFCLFFLYELLRSGGWVRYFPLQLSVTTVFSARHFFSVFFFSDPMF